MATLAVTNTFASAATITASGHNQNFSDVVNYINNRNSGVASWEVGSFVTATTVPLLVDNSTGSNSIAIFKDNGSAVVTIADGGNVGLGIAAPASSLHTAGTIQMTNASTGTASSDGFQISVPGGTTEARLIQKENDAMTFYTNDTARLRLESTGGMTLGGPTGGDKGAGTFNLSADLYKNNTAYTNPDYVFEKWLTGDIKRFAENEGAASYKGALDLDALYSYVNENMDLPGIKREGHGQGIFERADKVLEKLEEAYIYIFQLHGRIRAIESKWQT